MLVGCNISFIWLFAGAVEWQSYCFATNLLQCAPLSLTTVPVLCVVFAGIFLEYCYIVRPSWASLTTLVAFSIAFQTLCFFADHAHSERLRGN